MLRELPCGDPAEEIAQKVAPTLLVEAVRIGACPSDGTDYASGAWGTGYLLRGSDLRLQARGGTRFQVNSEALSIRIEVPDAAMAALEAEISAGLSSALPFLLREVGLYSLHAAAVRTSAGALLLPGLTGSGKSTTAGRLAALGWPLLSDDLLLLPADQPGKVLPFPREPRFRGVALARFPEITGMNLTPAEGPMPAVALVFPRVGNDASTRLEPMLAPSALSALIECSLMPGDAALVSHHFRLLAVLARLPCYQLTLGTMPSNLASLLQPLLCRLP